MPLYKVVPDIVFTFTDAIDTMASRPRRSLRNTS